MDKRYTKNHILLWSDICSAASPCHSAPLISNAGPFARRLGCFDDELWVKDPFLFDPSSIPTLAESAATS